MSTTDYNVIVKLTTRCNLSCEYCNVEESKVAEFSTDGIDALVDWLNWAVADDVCSILWHGGEPLVLGIAYFSKIFSSQKRYPDRFRNVISTNGTLLDDKTIDFLIENDVMIKTSLDNVDISLDEQRGYSCAEVIKSLDRLKLRNYSNVYVRTTVSKTNEAELPKIYGFMQKYSFKWEFAPIIPAGLKKESALRLLPSPKIFCDSALDIFRHWFCNDPFDMPFFSTVIKYQLGAIMPPTMSKPKLNIGPDGFIYRCPLLIGNAEYKVGHFSAETAYEGFCKLNCVWERISKSECSDCSYNRLCRISSCAYLSISLIGLVDIADYYCKLWRPIFSEICATVDSEKRLLETIKYRSKNSIKGGDE